MRVKLTGCALLLLLIGSLNGTPVGFFEPGGALEHITNSVNNLKGMNHNRPAVDISASLPVQPNNVGPVLPSPQIPAEVPAPVVPAADASQIAPVSNVADVSQVVPAGVVGDASQIAPAATVGNANQPAPLPAVAA